MPLNHRRRTPLLLAFVMALLPLVDGGRDAAAQGAASGARQMDQAPAPVTPFGPRRRPPQAAPGQPSLPKPQEVERFGIWRVLCEQVPVARDKTQRTCYVSASVNDPKRKGVFVSMLILKVRDREGKVQGRVVNLRAPVGVFLPTGIAMEVDGKAVARAPFTRCNPLFCESTNQARKETLDRLKKGKKARFIIYAAPGVSMPLEFDLKGFTAALKKADELP